MVVAFIEGSENVSAYAYCTVVMLLTVELFLCCPILFSSVLSDFLSAIEIMSVGFIGAGQLAFSLARGFTAAGKQKLDVGEKCILGRGLDEKFSVFFTHVYRPG